MLHGLESHSAWFSQSARHIAGLGYPVYGMERRGSGHSRAPRGVCTDYNDLLSDIDALAEFLLRHHDTEKFHLFGHCFGAIPATAYACRFPDKLRSLVLGTPAPYTKAVPAGRTLQKNIRKSGTAWPCLLARYCSEGSSS